MARITDSGHGLALAHVSYLDALNTHLLGDRDESTLERLHVLGEKTLTRDRAKRWYAQALARLAEAAVELQPPVLIRSTSTLGRLVIGRLAPAEPWLIQRDEKSQGGLGLYAHFAQAVSVSPTTVLDGGYGGGKPTDIVKPAVRHLTQSGPRVVELDLGQEPADDDGFAARVSQGVPDGVTVSWLNIRDRVAGLGLPDDQFESLTKAVKIAASIIAPTDTEAQNIFRAN